MRLNLFNLPFIHFLALIKDELRGVVDMRYYLKLTDDETNFVLFSGWLTAKNFKNIIFDSFSWILGNGKELLASTFFYYLRRNNKETKQVEFEFH